MIYKNLGRSGLKISELSFGSWLTFGDSLDSKKAKKCIQLAFELGVNFFDNAEVYGAGKSEVVMAEALSDFKREDIVVSTKLFWGGSGPNDQGLSRKHLFEGIRASLKRLKLTYVDLLFCHRPDPSTPIEETVRAMDQILRDGLALYWGTSEWSAEQIRQAYIMAKELNCVPPTMEQPQYNMFHRERVEIEYSPLYKEFGLGTTIWSPLASGILTGKYNNGIPKGSRLDTQSWLRSQQTASHIELTKQLEPLALELDCSLAQLAIAWCLKNPNVSTVILGATSEEQLKHNLQSLKVKERLDSKYMAKIENVINAAEVEISQEY